MKQNKFTIWLFNFLHKTRIKEKVEERPSGCVVKIYTPQYRDWCFIFFPVWINIRWSVFIADSVKGDMLDVAKAHIDQWLDYQRNEFFTTTKTKYIKYP